MSEILTSSRNAEQRLEFVAAAATGLAAAHRLDADAEASAPTGAELDGAGLDDARLMERVLSPYKPHCRYLVSADVAALDDGEGERVVTRCLLSIPESCYIDDTGHFNSVEFNICYNQMVYYAIAKAVDGQLLPVFKGWTIDDFWRKQLPDILITRFESCFRKPVQPRRFHGEVTLARARSSGGASPMMLMRTTCRFWDDDGGHCDGNIVLALLGGPKPAAEAIS